MSTSIPLNDLEGGSQAAQFTTVGDKYVGTIVAIDHRQQTDPKTGEPKHFQSGDPMMLYVITIQPDDGSDKVALWAKGGNYTAATGTGESMLSALGTAVRNAGASSVEVGGKVAVQFTGESKPNPGMNPAKLYTAQYEAPKAQTGSIPSDDLFTS